MDEAWIQQSLSRLETLETYKAQVQASGQAVDLSEVDAEIAALYEVLESAAEPEPAAQLEPATPFAASSPFEQPAYAPPVSPAMHAQAAPMSAPTYDPSMSMSYADIDDAPKGKGAFIAIGLLAVIGLGTGGWYVAGRGEPPPATAPAGDPTVINASSIPSDTQEPQVAKGGDASRTEGFKIKESNRPAPRANNDRRGPAPRGNDRPSPKKSGKDDRKVATINDSRDPLAGAR
jgi:hypothetical protein